jgi:hypothetical protein
MKTTSSKIIRCINNRAVEKQAEDPNNNKIKKNNNKISKIYLFYYSKEVYKNN